MGNKRLRKDYTESSRKSRVKMHKSGKHWVRTVMSQINLVRLFKGGSGQHEVKVERLEKEVTDYSVPTAL
ncbi:KxYKxGKxW signal peptide domain-containing protein, partial [Streptococcus sp. 11273D007BW]